MSAINLQHITLDTALNDPDPLFACVPPWASPDATGLQAIVRDYWRGEVERGSGALAILALVCSERGYDYQATIEALQ